MTSYDIMISLGCTVYWYKRDPQGDTQPERLGEECDLSQNIWPYKLSDKTSKWAPFPPYFLPPLFIPPLCSPLSSLSSIHALISTKSPWFHWWYQAYDDFNISFQAFNITQPYLRTFLVHHKQLSITCSTNKCILVHFTPSHVKYAVWPLKP